MTFMLLIPTIQQFLAEFPTPADSEGGSGPGKEVVKRTSIASQTEPLPQNGSCSSCSAQRKVSCLTVTAARETRSLYLETGKKQTLNSNIQTGLHLPAPEI